MGPVCQLSSHWPPHSSPVISISHMSWTPITHISISAECSKDVEKVAKHHNRPICKGLFCICVKSSRGWRENRSKEEDWNNLSFASWWKKGKKWPWLEEEWIKKNKKVGQNANDLFKMLTSFHGCVDDWMYASSHSMSKSMSSHSWLILKVDKSEDLEEETQVSEIPFLCAF